MFIEYLFIFEANKNKEIGLGLTINQQLDDQLTSLSHLG